MNRPSIEWFIIPAVVGAILAILIDVANTSTVRDAATLGPNVSSEATIVVTGTASIFTTGRELAGITTNPEEVWDQVYVQSLRQLTVTTIPTTLDFRICPDPTSAHSVTFARFSTGFVEVGSPIWPVDRPVTIFARPDVDVKVVRYY